MVRSAPALLCIVTSCLALVARADDATDRIARIEAAVAARAPMIAEEKVILRCKSDTEEMDMKTYQTDRGRSGRSIQGIKHAGVVPSTFGILDRIDPLRPIAWQFALPGQDGQVGPAKEQYTPILRVLPTERVAGVEYDVVEVTEDPAAPVNYQEIGSQPVLCKRRVRKLYIGKDNLIHRITGIVTYTGSLDLRPAKPGVAPEQEATFEVQVTSYHNPITVDPRPNSPSPMQTVSLEKPLDGPFNLSPNGKVCAVGTQDNAIHLLNGETGQEIRVMSGHQSRVTALAFTPDSRRLVSVDGLNMAVWDVETGQLIYTKVCPHQSKSLVIAPDGKVVVMIGMNAPLQALDLLTGKLLYQLNNLSAAQIAYSPDGSQLAVLTYDGLKMVDTRTWKVATAWDQIIEGKVEARVAFAPDGALLAVSGIDGPLLICDGHTGKQIRKIKDEIGYASHVWFSPDGATLTVLDSDQRGDIPTNAPGLTTWDTTTWQVAQSLRLNFGRLMGPAYVGSRNTLISGSRLVQLDSFGKQLRFWNLSPAPERRANGE